MKNKLIIEALSEEFQTHKRSQFTGVIYIGPGKTPQWTLYFHMGRMVWAHSRMHPIRRWHRQLIKHCPQVIKEVTQLENDIEVIPYAELHYAKIVAQVRQGRLNRINVAKAVEDYLSEVLFDIVHQGTLRKLQGKSEFKPSSVNKRFASNLFLIVRAEQAWQQTQYDWQAWQQAELVKCSPNLAPVIGQPEDLRTRTSEAVYQHLISIIDGKQTFRDLAVQLNQPLLPLTRRIIPYVRQGVIGLVRVSDLGAEADAANASKLSKLERSKGAIAPPAQSKRARQPSPKPNQTTHPKNSGSISSKSPSAPDSSRPARARTAANPKAANPKMVAVPRKLSKVASSSPLVIYIDDSPRDSKAMGDILQDAGFRFRSIQESTHALPLLIEHKPQLIFLDLVMPVANGYEICSQVRRVSLFKDIPIVIVTSNNTLADRVHAKMVGASGFLSKPIVRDKVLKTVHRLLSDTASPIQSAQTAAAIKSSLTKVRPASAVKASK